MPFIMSKAKRLNSYVLCITDTTTDTTTDISMTSYMVHINYNIIV